MISNFFLSFFSPDTVIPVSITLRSKSKKLWNTYFDFRGNLTGASLSLEIHYSLKKITVGNLALTLIGNPGTSQMVRWANENWADGAQVHQSVSSHIWRELNCATLWILAWVACDSISSTSWFLFHDFTWAVLTMHKLLLSPGILPIHVLTAWYTCYTALFS